MNSVTSYFVIGLLFLAVTGTLCVDWIGGVEAKPNEIPYQVSLRYTATRGHFCGGTLITDRHVLTAAQCTYVQYDPLKPSDIYAQMGSILISTGITRKVVTIQTHSGYYQFGYKDDIALLRLETPFTFTEAISNITQRATAVLDNENCTVSGFGTLKDGFVSSKLMVFALPIVNHDVCKKLYDSMISIDSKMICAGSLEAGKESCQGDTGSPLVCGGELTGIASYGLGCSFSRYPRINTEVFKYKDWIADAINGAISTTTLSICLFVLVQIILIFLH